MTPKRALDRAEIIRALVRRERARIKAEVERHPGMQVEGTECLVALAALPGKLTLADVAVLRQGVQQNGLLVPDGMQIMRCSLWQDDALAELQPDLLAAELLHCVLQKYIVDQRQIGDVVWQCLVLGGGDALRERLTRLARLAWDHARMAGGGFDLVLALVAALDHERARRVADAVDNDVALESPLQGLAVAAHQMLLKSLEALAREDFATHAPELARRLNNLSNRLADSGDRAGGLAAIRRAVEIYDALAQQNFAAYEPVLAASLNNLSNHLAESGDRTGGLAAIRRAAEIYAALAQQNFAAYGPVLAMSLNNLSICLAESGDRAGGLAEIRRAAEIHEALAQQNFAVDGPDLATGLNNLSLRLAESGDRVGGLAAIRRAVEIREALAQQNPTAYGPVLAYSLAILATFLAQGDDPAAAIVLLERAIAMIKPFAVPNTTHAQRLEQMQANLAQFQAP